MNRYGMVRKQNQSASSIFSKHIPIPAGGFLYERVNDQLLMIVMAVIYGAGTVLHPLLPDMNCLHVLGFTAGASIGISHIGNHLAGLTTYPISVHILPTSRNPMTPNGKKDAESRGTQLNPDCSPSGSQVRLVKIWAEDSAPAIQAIHASYGVGATIGPFLGAPFLSLRKEDVVLRVRQQTVAENISYGNRIRIVGRAVESGDRTLLVHRRKLSFTFRTRLLASSFS